jgi:hypothetical protein
MNRKKTLTKPNNNYTQFEDRKNSYLTDFLRSQSLTSKGIEGSTSPNKNVNQIIEEISVSLIYEFTNIYYRG